jgi:ABC-type molybdate transport system substrate-binding protein
MRDTENELISALQLGQIDYLSIYRSDALQQPCGQIGHCARRTNAIEFD